MNFSNSLETSKHKLKISKMDDLIVALGLFLFIEGILYALFPSKMKSMLEKLKMINDKQLRSGGIMFALIGFFIIWFIKG